MNDDGLESRLRRFTVVAPAAPLRARVLAEPDRRVFRRDALIGWAVAAGVAALACLGASVAGESRDERLRRTLADPASAERMAFIVDVLGPDAADHALFSVSPPRPFEEQVARAFQPTLSVGDESW